MSTFDRNWRELQLETLVDMSLTIGGVRPEEELVEELLQRAVGNLDAGSGFVATHYPGGHEAVVRSIRLPSSLASMRALFEPDLLEELAAGRVVRTVREGPEPPYELLAAPLRAGQETLGVVVIGDKETRVGRAPFSDSDARFLLSLATMVAPAVQTWRQMTAIERDRQRLREENLALRGVARREGFIGESQKIREVLDLVRRVAPTGANVMLRGESGVGKERVARLLHGSSDRASGTVRAAELRSPPGEPARGRAVRHRGGCGDRRAAPDGQDRACQRRHAFPGRGGRPHPRPPGQAAAGRPGA